MVNKDGDVVGKIETEEPGFFGSLVGEESKQVIVNDEGEKIATFETESPGFIGSLLGEKDKTVLTDEDGEKLAEFGKEEPGFVGKLLGDEPKTVLCDSDGDKLATFEREKPGFIASILGEEAKRLIHFEDDRVEALLKEVNPLTPESLDHNQDAQAYDAADFDDTPDESCSDEQMAAADSIASTDDAVEIESRPREVAYLMRSGTVQLHRHTRNATGSVLKIITFDSQKDYERHLRIIVNPRQRSLVFYRTDDFRHNPVGVVSIYRVFPR